MNIKTIIAGSLALGLVVGGAFFNMSSQDQKAVYTPRSVETGGIYGQAGYEEYMHMLKADPATGLIDYNLVMQARNEVIARSKMNNKAALGLNWTQMGPDNVGGRTRAILVDQNNANIVYAGGVAGGLFVSTDATGSWTPVTGMQGTIGENLAISCITQTSDGRIFFGTGASFENAFGNGGSGFVGNGVYEYVPSSGAVLPVITNSTAVPNNSTGSFWAFTNAIASRGNRLYLGTRDGMVWADPDGNGDYPTNFSGWTNPIWANAPTNTILELGTCQDIDIASDGSMLVSFSGKAYVSDASDALGDFTKIPASFMAGGSRWSGAIAPSNPNVMYMLRSQGTLKGLNISKDKGQTWSEIVPGGSPCIDPYAQNDCTGGQGGYDDAIAVDPGDAGHILVGGVQLYEWRETVGSNPIAGSWLKAANLFEASGNPFYVHADKHTIVWPTSNRVYVGGDGGVALSTDNGVTWTARNYGYNVTTFYDMGIGANGFFIGGAQDNGSQLFTYGAFGATTPLGTFEVTGGDGFDCTFSNTGDGIVYTTSQEGVLYRAAGGSPGQFYDAYLDNLVNTTSQPFHTVIENWEMNNDPLSIDSIIIAFNDTVGTIIKPAVYNATGDSILIPGDTVLAGETIMAGDTIRYTSLTNGLPLTYVAPSNITIGFPTDTLMLVDPIQNKFAFRTTAGIYMTRDAARLSATSTKWFKIAPNTTVENMTFSPDGNHVFLGTSNGGVVRVSGLSKYKTQAELDTSLTVTPIRTSLGGVVSIAVDPNDGNNIIVTSGGYTTGNHVYRCTNALTATSTAGTFTAIQGLGGNALPKMPVYDAVIDYNDNDKVIIGTEWGVWTCDNAFTAAATAVVWTDESSNGMAHVPIHAVEQQSLRSNHAVNSGFVYLATHGRGFFMTQDLFTGVEDNDFEEMADGNSFVTNLGVYPNPLNNVGVLNFDLKRNAETKIRIYNLTGALVKTIELGVKTQGEHSVKFDASSLSVGSYIISLESGSERSVAKFIVTR